MPEIDPNHPDSAESPVTGPTPQDAAKKPEPWIWTGKREKAAMLVAEDTLKHQEVADAIGINQRSLSQWKAAAEFKARVAEHVEAIREQVFSQGYCRVDKRIKLRSRIIDSMVAIVDERGARAEMQDAKVSGGKTGFVALQPRIIGSGADQMKFVEQVPDTAIANEIRVGLKEIAQEVGQFVEKHELTGGAGGPMIVRVSGDDANL